LRTSPRRPWYFGAVDSKARAASSKLMGLGSENCTTAVIMGALPDGSALALKGDVQLCMREYPRSPRLNSFMACAVALVSRVIQALESKPGIGSVFASALMENKMRSLKR